MKYKRILLKLSGEALMGEQQHGIDPERLSMYAGEISSVVSLGVQIGIVIGGGNIFRGLQGAAKGMDRVQGDYMGMLATVINSMALQAELEKHGMKTCLLSGIAIDPIAGAMSRRRAIEALNGGNIVIIASGTGTTCSATFRPLASRPVTREASVLQSMGVMKRKEAGSPCPKRPGFGTSNCNNRVGHPCGKAM